MTRTFSPSAQVNKIRSQIDHPIIDGDGHFFEFYPVVQEYLQKQGGSELAKRFSNHRRHPRKIGAYWGAPTKNTLDRATAILPDLMYRRLDEVGVDFALQYPSAGLSAVAIRDDELRVSLTRALNSYYADLFAPFRDRMTPIAVIPMFTPEEAIAALDHAVVKLGLKAVLMGGNIPRAGTDEHGAAFAWIDSLGHGSAFDYSPVWERCEKLGVVPTFHNIGFGWGTRVSTSNFVHNHIGHFATAQEAILRSLILGGVPMKFPKLKFAFLEGGVSWACQLYADLLGHYGKRNKGVIHNYDPFLLDTAMLGELFDQYATGPLAGRKDRSEISPERITVGQLRPDSIDDFAESGIRGPEDITRMFTQQFFFGCEADDPLNALAFNDKLLPHGARLNAVLGSDIGHWDVTDIREVLPEAWEMVEDGHLELAQFREFSFGNVVRMLTSGNPQFFDGTVVETAVRSEMQTRRLKGEKAASA